MKRLGKVKDMVNQRFGRLFVLRQAPSDTKRAKWLCLCDCGKEKIATGKDIRAGKVASCTCLRSEMSVERARKNTIKNTLPWGEGAFNQMYGVYDFHARKRNLEFMLSKDEFKALTKENCFYCGVAPYQEYRKGSNTGAYVYNGIDRVANSEGYVLENCVACCGVCNDMKRTRSESEFILACHAVVEHQKKRAEELLRLSLPKLVNA